MMKRGREGKTESISTDRFADAVMDVNSEVTADDLLKDIKKGLTDTAKWIKNTPVYKEGEKIVKNPIGYSVSVGKQVGNEIGYRSIQGWNEVNKIGASKEKKEQLDRNTQNAKAVTKVSIPDLLGAIKSGNLNKDKMVYLYRVSTDADVKILNAKENLTISSFRAFLFVLIFHKPIL